MAVLIRVYPTIAKINCFEVALQLLMTLSDRRYVPVQTFYIH